MLPLTFAAVLTMIFQPVVEALRPPTGSNQPPLPGRPWSARPDDRHGARNCLVCDGADGSDQCLDRQAGLDNAVGRLVPLRRHWRPAGRRSSRRPR